MLSTQRKDRNAEALMHHETLIVQITGHKPAVGYPGRPAHTTEKVARIKITSPHPFETIDTLETTMAHGAGVLVALRSLFSVPVRVEPLESTPLGVTVAISYLD